MANLASLPNELLIPICQGLTIPALFNLRLAHPRLAAVILNEIIHIAPSVVANTVSHQVDMEPLLCRHPGERPDFEWLRRFPVRYNAHLTLRWLDSNRYHPTAGIIPPGSEFTEQVEDGWLVINSLSQISKRYTSRIEQQAGQHVSPKGEETLAAQFKKYLLTLSEGRLENYRITMWLLQMFCFEEIYDGYTTAFFPMEEHRPLNNATRYRDFESVSEMDKELIGHRAGYCGWPFESAVLEKDRILVAYEKFCSACCSCHILIIIEARPTGNIESPHPETLPDIGEALAMATISTGVYPFFLSWSAPQGYCPMISANATLNFLVTQWAAERKSDYLDALHVIDEIIKSRKIGKEGWIEDAINGYWRNYYYYFRILDTTGQIGT